MSPPGLYYPDCPEGTENPSFLPCSACTASDGCPIGFEETFDTLSCSPPEAVQRSEGTVLECAQKSFDDRLGDVSRCIGQAFIETVGDFSVDEIKSRFSAFSTVDDPASFAAAFANFFCPKGGPNPLGVSQAFKTRVLACAAGSTMYTGLTFGECQTFSILRIVLTDQAKLTCISFRTFRHKRWCEVCGNGWDCC